MASQGPLSPGTIVNDPATGLFGYGGPMTNPDNVKVSDNVYATNQESPGNNRGVAAKNFGFSVPTGSTIDGILVEVEGKEASGNTRVNAIKTIKADGTIGTTQKGPSSYWNGTDTYYSFGSSSDLWGDTWTAEDINDTDFGTVLLVSGYENACSMDHIRITVYYTAGGGSANTGFFGLM